MRRREQAKEGFPVLLCEDGGIEEVCSVGDGGSKEKSEQPRINNISSQGRPLRPLVVPNEPCLLNHRGR